MFGRNKSRVFSPDQPQEAPQQRLRASFGGRRGEDVISRRVEHTDPVPAALDTVLQAVRTAQELGATQQEIYSVIREAVTAQGGYNNGGLLPQEPYGSHRQEDEAGPYPRGNGG